MKAASLVQIRKELETCTHARVIELTLKLSKYKIENKELLSYLLFDSDDQDAYIRDVKDEISHLMLQINSNYPYTIKKSFRKILKSIAKYVKYMGSKEAEISLLVFFCKEIHQSNIPIYRNKGLYTLYEKQIERIAKLIPVLDDELQYDYKDIVRDLSTHYLKYM